MKLRTLVWEGLIAAFSLGLVGMMSTIGMTLTASQRPTVAVSGGHGTNVVLTADASGSLLIQPDYVVGGPGGGVAASTTFSPMTIKASYTLVQGGKTLGGSEEVAFALCSHMQGADNNAVNYCQENVSGALGNSIWVWLSSRDVMQPWE